MRWEEFERFIIGCPDRIASLIQPGQRSTQPSTKGYNLWAAANILRGNPVDRKDWKSYILPLLHLDAELFEKAYGYVRQYY